MANYGPNDAWEADDAGDGGTSGFSVWTGSGAGGGINGGDLAADDTDVVSSGSGGDQDVSSRLLVTGFDLEAVEPVPDSETVTNVKFEILRSAMEGDAPGDYIRDNQIMLIVGGVVQTADNQADTETNWPTADTYAEYNFAVSLSAAQANANDFGVAIRVLFGEELAGSTGFINHVRVTFTTAAAGPDLFAAAVVFGLLDEE